MPEKDKKLIQRYGHVAATVTVNSDCVEVILFGGEDKKCLLYYKKTVVACLLNL